MRDTEYNFYTSELGIGLFQAIVAAALGLVIMTSVASQFFQTSKHSFNHQLALDVEEQAKLILDMISADMRYLGSSLPISQDNFLITDALLGDAPHPILVSSDDEKLDIRLNPDGNITVLTADYTPSLTALTFAVLSASSYQAGDTVYISNMSVGGEEGFQGVVTSVSGNNISVDTSFIASSGATFGSGSIVERSSYVTYESTSNWDDVTRTDEYGTVTVHPRGRFEVRYLDMSGAEISLPLTPSSIKDDLAAVEITVSVQGELKRKDGEVQFAEAKQIIGLRNLSIGR